jgi:hypothetical protein
LDSQGAVGADLVDEVIGYSGVAKVVDHNVGTLAGDSKSGGFADSLGGAGDEENFSSQRRHCSVELLL